MKGLFFLSFFIGQNMIYYHVRAIRDPLKQDLAPEFCRNQKKSSVTWLKLIQTMVKYTIQEKIDWVTSFSLLDIVTQLECFFCFIWVLKVSLRLTLIQKGSLCPLRLLPLMIEFSVCAPSGYSTRDQLTSGALFSRTFYGFICIIKMRERKTK